MSDAGIVIAGAGHAGGAAAAALRQFGWKGGITLIGDEPILPYQRPPLSKAWLKGEATAASLALRPERFYTQQTIDLRLSCTVVSIDRVQPDCLQLTRCPASSTSRVLPPWPQNRRDVISSLHWLRSFRQRALRDNSPSNLP